LDSAFIAAKYEAQIDFSRHLLAKVKRLAEEFNTVIVVDSDT